jgi:hypothetical protein
MKYVTNAGLFDYVFWLDWGDYDLWRVSLLGYCQSQEWLISQCLSQFPSIRQLGVSLPLNGMLVHCKLASQLRLVPIYTLG